MHDDVVAQRTDPYGSGMRTSRWVVAAVAATSMTTTALVGAPARAVGVLPGPGTIAVSGRHLVDQFGLPVRLIGVNRSGSEYQCSFSYGESAFEGPVDDNAVAAIAAWNVNVVRVPLNEDCWLGINGAPVGFPSAQYRQEVIEWVNRLHAHGMLAILDLHANAPGAQLAHDFREMADADHSPEFWRSVASTFLNDHGVLFDVFNEPHNISWDCWRAGCTMPGGWHAAGMQSLIDAVRSTGATQPIMLGGLSWSSDLTQWMAHMPFDPQGQLVASMHAYNFNFGPFAGSDPLSCDTACRVAAWDANPGSVASSVPVVTGEIGEDDCQHSFVDDYMAWADSRGISYLGWTWNAGGGWTCDGGPTLITDYDGTPSGMGIGFRDHVAGLVYTEDVQRVLSALS
jgi:aryl-phospho-beta-D-glucosidase BglC (GH1 family)